MWTCAEEWIKDVEDRADRQEEKRNTTDKIHRYSSGR